MARDGRCSDINGNKVNQVLQQGIPGQEFYQMRGGPVSNCQIPRPIPGNHSQSGTQQAQLPQEGRGPQGRSRVPQSIRDCLRAKVIGKAYKQEVDAANAA